MGLLAIAFFLIYIAVTVVTYNLYVARIESGMVVSLPKEILGVDSIDDSKKVKPWARIFAPIFDKMENIPVFGMYKKRLDMAGYPMRLGEFIALKIIVLGGFLLIAAVLFKMKSNVMMYAALLGFFGTDIWLNRKVKERQRHIVRDLPAVIDLLKLCVGAGLDFMLAVERVIRDFKPCELVNELKIVWQETQIGKSRKDAMINMAKRINMPQVYSFVRTLVQAGRMGSPIGEALKVLSEEIRMDRFQRGEEMALKAPIKLLFPLIAFILPVVLLIVAGPIILRFMRGGLTGQGAGMF